MKKILLVLSLVLSAAAFAVPAGDLVDLKGNPAKIEHGKKKNLVMFWASWCGTCKYKLKKILPEMAKRKDVGVVTINIDKNVKRAKHYVKKHGIEVPVFRVKKGTPAANDIVKQLKVVTAPHWAVYEQTGKDWKLVNQEVAWKMENIEAALK